MPRDRDAPFLTYNHSASVVADDGCPIGSSAVAGLAFYQGGSNYPASYQGALFFSDYSRKCMWVMFAGRQRQSRTRRTTAAFASGAAQGLSTCRSARTATSTTSTSTAAGSCASSTACTRRRQLPTLT